MKLRLVVLWLIVGVPLALTMDEEPGSVREKI